MSDHDFTESAKELARAIKKEAQGTTKYHSRNACVGTVMPGNELRIQLSGSGLTLDDDQFDWTVQGAAIRDQLTLGDSVVVESVDGRYVVMDAYEGDATEPGGGGGPTTSYLDDLLDVAASGPSNGQTIGWNSTNNRYELTTFAPVVHTHSIADVSGLQAALDGKALLVHTHPFSSITGTIAAGQYGAGSIVNADVNAAAAIAYSKLSLASSIVNADIAAAAAIAYSKLSLAGSVVNADINASAGIVISKLAAGTAPAGTYNFPTLQAGGVAVSVVGHTHAFSAITGTTAAGQYGAGSIVNADINAAAAIALSKLATDPLARANHTGTQLASTISNFDTQVRTSRLDQMAAPASAVGMGSQRIVSLADPTSAQDAATKNYVDGLVQGLDSKVSVRVAYFTNQTLSGAAAADAGVTPANGERVLVGGQTTAANNGIYVVNTGGAWTRSADADTWAELISAYVFVEAGTYADNGFTCIVDPGGTLGTTAVTWTQFSGAGQIIAGAGLSKTGNQLDVNVDSTTVEIVSDTLQLKAAGVQNSHIGAAAGITISKLAAGTAPAGTYNFPTLQAGGVAVSVAGHTHSQSDITSLVSDLANRLQLTGGTLSGLLNIDNLGLHGVYSSSRTAHYLTPTDAYPIDMLGDIGGSAKLSFGAGGATALDWTMARTAAGVAALGAGNKLQMSATPTVPNDLVNKAYADGFLPLAGGTMTGALLMMNAGISRRNTGDTNDRSAWSSTGVFWGPGNAATDVGLSRQAAGVMALEPGNVLRSDTNPSNVQDLARKAYVDLFLPLAGGTLTGNLALASGAFLTASQGTYAMGAAASIIALSDSSSNQYTRVEPGMLGFAPATTGIADWQMTRTAAGVAALGATHKLQMAATPTVANDLTNKAYTDAQDGLRALDTAVMHLAGTETATGDKTFTGNLSMSGSGTFWANTNNPIRVSGRLYLRDDEYTTTSSIDTIGQHKLYTGTGGHTFTLPTLSGSTYGTIWIHNIGTGNLTVSRASTNVIYLAGSTVTSFVLKPGDSVMLMHRSSSTTSWVGAYTGGPQPSGFVLKTGDTMSGALTLDNGSSKTVMNPGAQFQWFNSSSDTYGATVLGLQGLRFGAGGATDVDWRIYRTAANEATIEAGDVLKMDTMPEGTANAVAATTLYVDRAMGYPNAVRPTAVVYRSAALNLASTTVVPIPMDVEEYITDAGMHSTVTNSTRVYAPATGTYELDALLAMANNAAGSAWLSVRKNAGGVETSGTAVTGRVACTQNVGSSLQRVASASVTVQLNAGDYVELFGFQNSASTVALGTGTAEGMTKLTLTWVGGAGSAWGNAYGRMALTSAQSCAHGSWVDLSFNTTLNTGAGVTTATGTVPLTCVTPGSYPVTARVDWSASSSAGGRSIRLVHKNSAGTIIALYADGRAADSFSRGGVGISEIIPMAVGDFIQVQLLQTSGAALNTAVTDGTYHATVSMGRMGFEANPVKSYSVRVRRDAAYSLAHGTTGAMTWDTVERNTNNMWSAASPTRITFPVAGWYMFGAEFGMASANAASSPYASHIQYNGTPYAAISYIESSPGGRAEPIASGLRYFNAGDYITAFPYQVSGGTVNGAVTEDTNVFWATRVAD